MFESIIKKYDPSNPESYGVLKFFAEKRSEDERLVLINELFAKGSISLPADIANTSDEGEVLIHTRKVFEKSFYGWIKKELQYSKSMRYRGRSRPRLTYRKKQEFTEYVIAIGKLGLSAKIKASLQKLIYDNNKFINGQYFEAIFRRIVNDLRLNQINELGLFIFSLRVEHEWQKSKVNYVVYFFLNELAFSSAIFEICEELIIKIANYGSKLFSYEKPDLYSLKGALLTEIVANRKLDISKHREYIRNGLSKLAPRGTDNLDLLEFLARFNYDFQHYNFEEQLQLVLPVLTFKEAEEHNSLVDRLSHLQRIIKSSSDLCDYIIFHLERLPDTNLIQAMDMIKEVFENTRSQYQRLVGFKEYDSFEEIRGVRVKKKWNRKSENKSLSGYLVDIKNDGIVHKCERFISEVEVFKDSHEVRLSEAKQIRYGFLPLKAVKSSGKSIKQRVDIDNPEMESYCILTLNLSVYQKGQAFVLDYYEDKLYQTLNKYGIHKLFGKFDLWVFNQSIKYSQSNYFRLENKRRIESYFNFIPTNNKVVSEKNEGFEPFIQKYYPEIFNNVIQKERNEKKALERINRIYDSNEVCLGRILNRKKGGLIVDLFGIEVFLPGSQIDIKPVIDYEKYVGKEIELKVIKINNEFKNVVVSHRVILEAELEEQKEKIISNLEKGQVILGTVENFVPYGVFVDLGGVKGLVHISDIDWVRIKHPEEVLQINQQIKVVILNFDRDKRKIALGRKQLLPNPWDLHSSELLPGEKVKGIIRQITEFGLFVEVHPGVEGLLHNSEIALNPAQKKYVIEDKIEVIVISVDIQNRKMSLSLKGLVKDPWENIKKHISEGQKITGTINGVVRYGLFVELMQGVVGLVHISNISWNQISSDRLIELFCAGDDIEVVVLEIDVLNERISLGIKQLFI